MTLPVFFPFPSSGNDPLSLSPLPILPERFSPLFLPDSFPLFLVIRLLQLYNHSQQDAFSTFPSLQIPNSP